MEIIPNPDPFINPLPSRRNAIRWPRRAARDSTTARLYLPVIRPCIDWVGAGCAATALSESDLAVKSAGYFGTMVCRSSLFSLSYGQHWGWDAQEASVAPAPPTSSTPSKSG